MPASIPASEIVNVFPNVIAAGGSGLDLVGLFLSSAGRVPALTVEEFASSAAVAAYFGNLSAEARLATVYFDGFAGSAIKPAKMLFANYNAAAAPAYLRGGAVSSLTIAQLQALSGTLELTINGRLVTSDAIDLSGAASFSAAAVLIAAGLDDADAAFTGEIAGATLTVTDAVGTLAVGQTVTGVGVAANTVITALGTGEGGDGTYTVSPSQTVASGAMRSGPTLVTFDAVSGAFVITGGTPGATGAITFAEDGALATGLRLTSSTGATLSQGAAAATPGTIMDALTAFTQDFVTFGTVFQPTIDEKVAFAAWANGQNNRFLYLMGESNPTAGGVSDDGTAGGQIRALEYSATAFIYDPVDPAALVAFVAGAVASVDFNATEGRTTLAFRRSARLTPGVTDKVVGEQLIANGYNFFGAYATAADRFVFLYPGQVRGPYLWIDSFINQVWLSNNFQLSLMNLLVNVRSIPYNSAGYAIIEEALSGPIDAGLSFGAIRAGVPLSADQTVAINTEAGLPVAQTITERGWYLQVRPASPQVRAERGSPPITFWYADGQSVQKINLNSTQVQ